MIQYPAHNLWIFTGAEATEPGLEPESFYVGFEPGSEIVEGPCRSEHSARFRASMLIDTVGT